VTANAEGEARHTTAEATKGSENVRGPVVTANAEGEARHTAAEATLGSGDILPCPPLALQ